jgi:DNA-binding MarR family transcriptional regulator
MDNPDVNARQLARALAITPPNLVGRLEAMQSSGFIERRRSEQDGRAQHIRLTSAGRRLVQRYAAALASREAQALAGLTAGERAILVELLHKVALVRR